MRRGLRSIPLVVACAFAFAACSVDTTVTVRMRENGSGVVRVRVALDSTAVHVAEIGGRKLEDRVRISDLPDAGWRVTPWRRATNGGATLVVSKPFYRPSEVGGLVAELNGASGPLRRFRASRDASMFSTTWKVDGLVDLRTVDLGIANDRALVAKLAAERVDVSTVEQRVTRGLLDGLRVHAVAELPGGQRTAAVATPGKRALLAASADATDTGRLLLLGGGVAIGLLAVGILVVGERRAHRQRRSEPREPVR